MGQRSGNSGPEGHILSTVDTAKKLTMRTADQLVAGLLPPDRLQRTERIEPLPLAPTRLALMTDRSLQYAIGRVDKYGTVPAAHLLDELGWRPGIRIIVSVEHGVAVFQRDPAGPLTVSKRRTLVVPAYARRACGIRSADSLLLVAAPDFATLVVHPTSALDRMMTLYHQHHEPCPS
jgi:hypothetical protein